MKRHGGNLNAYEVREASMKKGCLLYDPSSVTFWKRQNDGDGEKVRGCQGFGGKRDKQREHRGWLGQ